MNQFVYVDLKEPPHDADPTAPSPSRFTFGTDMFGGSSDWVIVENTKVPRVYKLPVPVSRILNHLMLTLPLQGANDVRRAIRGLLGIDE